MGFCIQVCICIYSKCTSISSQQRPVLQLQLPEYTSLSTTWCYTRCWEKAALGRYVLLYAPYNILPDLCETQDILSLHKHADPSNYTHKNILWIVKHCTCEDLFEIYTWRKILEAQTFKKKAFYRTVLFHHIAFSIQI